MGRLHARAYSQMPGVRLVGVYDTNPVQAASVAAEFHCQAFNDIETLLPHVAAVTIAAPTRFHAEAAEPFLRKRIACLIEKPLAAAPEEAARLVELARQYSAIVQVGHIERFNPAIRALEQLNLKPRFIEAVRVSPMPFRSLDVGVVLDIMIHDLDIVLHLTRSPVARVDAVGVSVIGQVEDICNARLTFENGCVANLTASRLALKTERRLRLFCADAFVSIDYQNRDGVIARRGPNLDALRQTADRVRTGQLGNLSQLNYGDMIHLEKLVIDNLDPLQTELEAFIESARTGRPSPVPPEAGLAAVTLAHQIISAITPHMNL
jgi:predicted dehydrogenase